MRIGSVPDGRRTQRKKAAQALVHELLAQGHSRRAIARHLGWGLNTVLRYARAAHWQDTLRKHRPRPTGLGPYKPYPERRFAAGCAGVTRLHFGRHRRCHPRETAIRATAEPAKTVVLRR
ncbi:helix-turn-helix domain-containing protein [Streptomyces sp. NPDC004227]